MWIACLLAGSFGRVTALPVEPGHKVREALLVDIEQNQQLELVLGLHSAESGERRLECWRRGEAGYSRDPRGSVKLPEDAIAFAYAALGTPSRELVIFTSRAAYKFQPTTAEERDPWLKLFGLDLLWTSPDPSSVFHLQSCVRDLDGDGLEEFVLPDNRCWTVHRRDGQGGWTASRHELRSQTLDERFFRAEIRNENRPSQRFTRVGRRRDDLPRFNNWISLSGSVPNFVCEDIDGDRKPDLGVLSDESFLWWKQLAGGALSAEVRREAYPLASKELNVMDLTRSVRIQDLNADGRADVLGVAPGNLEKNQTQALIWMGSEKDGKALLFPGEKKPAQALILDGLAQAIALRDIDGNGFPDLVIRALKPDLIDVLRSAATQEIDLQMQVFLNQKGVFSRRPDLSWTESTKAGFSTALFELLGDITGDGVSEAMIRSKEDSARVISFRRGRDGRLTLLEKALWEGNMKDRLLLVPSAIRADSPDVFWYTEESISCLSLR